MHPLERIISNSIIQGELIKDDEHVILVGLSGGPDSVALLHGLLPLQIERGVSLAAAYVNHGLRPAESEQEESFVRSMCSKLGVLYDTARVNVREYAQQQKISLEHAARDLRYKALREIAFKHNASLIAVAHTADDQAEEILIRLLRGSGRKGLSGMRSRSGDIIRPMLSLSKESILSYLKDKHIPYCTDSSNTDMRFVRNRVRHELIPFLEDTFDRGVRSSLCKTADSLADDETLLEELTDKALHEVCDLSDSGVDRAEIRFTLDRKKFAELPAALQRRVIEKLLWQLYSRANYTHIMKIVTAALSGNTGTEIHLSRGLRVGIQRDLLEFLYPQGQSPWRGRLYAKR